jgi:hypothetical protein
LLAIFFNKGQTFHALFLRPTLVYGEGLTKLGESLRTVANAHGGRLPTLGGGPSNGMLQYVFGRIWKN